MALKRKSLRKTYTILSSAISEWKWPSNEEAENRSEPMLSEIYDDFDTDSSDDEIHITSSE